MHNLESLKKNKLGGKKLGPYSLTFSMIPSSKLVASLLVLLPLNKLLVKISQFMTNYRVLGACKTLVLKNRLQHFHSVG